MESTHRNANGSPEYLATSTFRFLRISSSWFLRISSSEVYFSLRHVCKSNGENDSNYLQKNAIAMVAMPFVDTYFFIPFLTFLFTTNMRGVFFIFLSILSHGAYVLTSEHMGIRWYPKRAISFHPAIKANKHSMRIHAHTTLWLLLLLYLNLFFYAIRWYRQALQPSHDSDAMKDNVKTTPPPTFFFSRKILFFFILFLTMVFA